MPPSKKPKHKHTIPDRQIKLGGYPGERTINQGGDPNSMLGKNPSWVFHRSDSSGAWAISKESLGDKFWSDVFPKLKSWESMTWSQILIAAKKNNHSIEVSDLNKAAQDRLEELQIHEDVVYSLRVDGQTRVYGLMYGAVFAVLWCDFNHGDNDSCVCRSKLKHT